MQHTKTKVVIMFIQEHQVVRKTLQRSPSIPCTVGQLQGARLINLTILRWRILTHMMICYLCAVVRAAVCCHARSAPALRQIRNTSVLGAHGAAGEHAGGKHEQQLNEYGGKRSQ